MRVQRGRRRRTACALLVLLAPVLAVGCTNVMSMSAAPAAVVTASGTFAPFAPGATSVTYDPKLVPVGATASVTIAQEVVRTQVRLTVAGLLPDRGYGAHLHTDPCGPTGEAAGPHYQHRPDPAATAAEPSVDPAYANPHNEVWLDFHTDANGHAASAATQMWTFSSLPRSLIIHAMTTETAPGVAGMAGARLACLTLPA